MNDDSTFQIWCYICDVGYQLGVLFLDFDLSLWLFSEDHSTQGIEDDADSIMETFIPWLKSNIAEIHDTKLLFFYYYCFKKSQVKLK